MCVEDQKRRSQVKLGSAADFSLDITETDLSLLTASISAPSGRAEPCLLKRLANNHIGQRWARSATCIDLVVYFFALSDPRVLIYCIYVKYYIETNMYSMCVKI